MYGIDVSTYQSTLDMAAVAAAGNLFSGVKSVASYRPELTVADDYRNNVDRIMAAGLRKYPYAVPNNQNTPEATAQFMVANAYRRTDRDCWMLDNEPLNTYGVFWSDDFVYRFWHEMQVLGINLARGIEYCPASLTRGQSWPKLIKLREEWGLQIQWVSYGDMDPYYEDGEQPFVGQTGLHDPESHQFTSSYTIPGYGGLIDRVFSRLTLNQMFGEDVPMPRTPSGAFAWAAFEGQNGRVLDNWGGWCEKFINNSGAFNQAFASAEIAGNNSGPLRRDYENARRGAIIYWGGVGGLGHDAWVYEQGADPLLLMASNAARFPAWGHGIGLIRLSQYQAAFGHPLKGWTLRHGTETLDFSGTAGGGGTPIEEDDMYSDQDRARDNNTAGFVWAGGPSAEDPDYLGMPGTIYNLLKGPVTRSSKSAPTALPANGDPIAITQIQDNADTNSIARQLWVEVVALKAAVLALATGSGDPAGVKAAIKEAVDEALADVRFTFDGAGEVKVDADV